VRKQSLISITGPKIYTSKDVLASGSIRIADGVIQQIADSKIPNATFQFREDYHLVPGFIDLHVHGANGCDVMDGTDAALHQIAHTLAIEGTTSFLATTMTAPIDAIERALVTIAQFNNNKGAKLLGVHLEGPFISAKKSGAQAAQYILEPDIQYVEKWQKLSKNAIKIVTFAPEKTSSHFIRELLSQNIIPAMGHSDATFDETCAAIANGAHYVTHLWNAMRGIHQREPGMITSALLSEEVYTELIADGVHLHPAILQFILKIKNKDKILLVTDAMRAKCMPDGCYELGGQNVQVNRGIATLNDGTLAGSTLKMTNAVQNIMRYTPCDFMTAVQMATENPARVLKIFDKKGSIDIQKDADLLVLDEKFNVVLTIREGQVIFNRTETLIHA
jgi:N-acetylglucosamine-6-phosphate deacetylase